MAGAVVAGACFAAAGGDPPAAGWSSAQAVPAPSANTSNAAATTDDRVIGPSPWSSDEMEIREGRASYLTTRREAIDYARSSVGGFAAKVCLILSSSRR